MTWLAPWVWAGALLAAVPVLIHLLSRSSARQQRFPTLRFFDDGRIQAVRRSRITDLPLLLLRVLIVLLAVAALAQPRLDSAGRQAALAQRVARIVVVDTSASMQRLTPAGASALEEARHRAAAYDGATTVIETDDPASTLPGATSLLAQRSGVREVVIISDFQTGTLDSLDVAALDEGTGLQLERIATTGDGADDRPFRTATREVLATAGDGGFRWTGRSLPADSAALSAAHLLTIRASDGDAVVANAIRSAALASAQLPPSDRRMTLVMPGYVGRDSIAAAARPVTTAWIADAVMVAAEDRTARAGSTSPALAAWPDADGVVSVAEDDGGMLLLVHADAEALAVAAVLAALVDGAAVRTPLRERSAGIIEDAELARLERAAVPAVAGSDLDISDGRWLWLAALLLLGVEALVRRRAVRRTGRAT